jgi:hypothetical protein
MHRLASVDDGGSFGFPWLASNLSGRGQRF